MIWSWWRMSHFQLIFYPSLLFVRVFLLLGVVDVDAFERFKGRRHKKEKNYNLCILPLEQMRACPSL